MWGETRAGGPMSATADVAALFRKWGCDVWPTGTNRRSRIAVGFPDLIVLHNKFVAPIAFEVKGPGDKLSQQQIQLGKQWANGHGDWDYGYLGEAEEILRAAHIIPQGVSA